ncbi:MAG: alkaline phosphatase family protein [Acidobacteria bacterium]|nr:alkaline phosphatase family protein [Acidobacteriota bacterium]
MKRIHRLPISVSAAAALLLVATHAGAPDRTGTPQGKPGAANSPAVVLVSLDGFPAAALADPDLPAPALRALIASGASAKGMTGVNPAVTWPTHTTFVTGVLPDVHGVLFNGLLIRQPGALPRIEPWRDKAEMVRVETVYDAAFRAGLSTAQVDWVAIQNPGTITWDFAERPDPKGSIARELIAAGLAAPGVIDRFAKMNIVAKDQTWTTAAVHIIERHQPNLLMLHLLALDSTHHRYGPGTPAAYATIGFVDAQLARVIEAVRRSPMKDRTTVMVVSDHGFKTATRSIRPNAILRRAGLLQVDDAGRNMPGDAFVISEGGTAMVYALENRERLVPKLAQLFRGAPGIARVLEPAEFAALGYPAPDRNAQMGDLVLVAADDHSFSGSADGDDVVDNPQPAGFHGALNTDPAMDSIFVAWGYGIRPGVRVERVSAVQVAPTIAALLDLRMSAAGAPIDAILSAPDKGRRRDR